MHGEEGAIFLIGILMVHVSITNIGNAKIFEKRSMMVNVLCNVKITTSATLNCL